jgi:hypothetical protein
MKIFLEAFRRIFIHKPLISINYQMKFLERIGKKRKLSEALAEMFGNVWKRSESFSEEWTGPPAARG